MTELLDVSVPYASVLAAIHAEAFPAGGSFGTAWGRDGIGIHLALAGSFAVLAVDAGFAMARVAADESELLTLAVRPARRRAGIGRALLQAVLQRAASRGARVMFLEVAEMNDAARMLYATAGFAEAGRRPSYYGATDALVMRTTLAE